MTFRLEDGKTLELGRGDPQLRHLDHAWASTVHAFQGRTVDNVIAVMESRHKHLTTQKSFYVEISRARDRAELVTDDAAELKAQLEAVTGERIAALEAIGEMPRDGAVKDAGTGHGEERGRDIEPAKTGERQERAAPRREREAARETVPQPDRGETPARERGGAHRPAKPREAPVRERGGGRGVDLGL